MINKVFSAKQLDDKDPLRHVVSQFALPPDTIYLDGNSLGPLPKAAEERARDVVTNQWGKDLIKSWNCHDWIRLPQKVGDKIGALIGAEAGQVVSCDSISINLFKVLSAALNMQSDKKVIATTRDNFPTDIYMVQGLLTLLGDDYSIRYIDEGDIEGQLSDDIAVLMLTQVNFRSGFKLNMETITRQAQKLGILTLWDLAHSAGAFPVELDKCNVDFAVGCTYKYLNGGPGAPAFVYVAQRHQQQYRQPLSGWMGHQSPFAFTPDYEAADSVSQNLCGTPGILSMSVLDAALSVFDDISLKAIDEKSKKLQAFFAAEGKRAGLCDYMDIVSPPIEKRGSQVALSHPEAYAICQAWIGEGVIADFRAPNILRIGFAPLYLSFEDIEVAVSKLADIMKKKTYEKAEFQRKQHVT
ncbi:MAG: kynureninase [Alteromonadaceae bacterium TMED7]|nr:kynureninase [Alteromonadaceae bacterium]RPH17413.1 MAG: kynureninase [Alteromonadaceae bacterium TMED7]|tara:strand:+ start:44578 stop:45813 length:1236 start_codon:yes stop_codon:yes gene_type:complete